ncbi:putative mediator of RNA polymerase II transcription subunit 26 isoform X2 [Culex quinquefasciatus]|uniref:putative mediator of RNA polymerase II transcription subunit 26 isoform X2 n=1 Tax=Culex quinquefasciatus TaxID=7176 RepID=UPI0018E2AC6D|nr:putative mediator of RNA polymerase II transcription subunit 26 isoform X2 [Culex quinquefasciatus]
MIPGVGFPIDPPTFTTMESKKLQQLQQANSHLAPIPQTKPPTFQQQNAADYRPSRASPVFQNHPQYQSFASNFAQINYPHQIRPPQQVAQQQQQQHLSAHSSPKSNSNSLYLSEYSSSSQQQQQQQQPSQQQHHHNTIGSHYHFDQIYQTSSPSSGSGERERLYQTAPRPTQHTHTPSQPGPPQPLTKLELQFQQLQREKIQAQIKTATEALAHQQQTFALRQQLNPPVPNYHLKQNLLQNLSQQHQQQIQHQQQQLQRNAPPSSLNLTSHFQPAQGPMKLTNHANIHDYGATAATNQHAINEAFYQQQQQKHIHAVINKTPNNMQSPAPNQIIIQQNIPGQVVNQACQTQISGVKNNQQQQNQKSPNSDSMSSPSHDGLERRKSGPVHTLKSPVTKRPLNAPVSMSGWLYKQGSDGLKVWRRRWFVLSEYILYYYKSQEEEKLLGTVLLPSYKISACFPEDKVYRKFAFKCEHTNMRTFVFAAETGESMTNWVRALTLATMMQGSSESETSPPSNNARSGDNSDSGIQTYQSQVCKTGASQGPVTPVSDNGGGSQPLYANAPPKPRRANDGGYSSPSPEHIPSERYDQDQQQIYGKTPDSSFMQQSPQIKQQQQQQQHLGYDPNAYPSPGGAGGGQTVYNDAIYGNAKRIERDLYIQKLIQQQQQQQAQLQQLQQQQQVQQQVQQLAMQQTPQRAFTNPFMYPNADRRTPDTYGPPRAALDKHMSDYEDIYNLTMLSKSLPAEDPTPSAATAAAGYRRPMSPLRYDGQNMPMRYTPNYLENNSPAQQQHVQMRARPVQSTIPRPHSADFLEYEARNPIGANSLNGVKGGKLKDGEPARAPRPKSSLDINRTPDNYYYSEASYAEKMRMQSASYLQRAANLGAVAGKEVPGAVNSSTVPRDGYYGGASSSNGRLDYDENVLHQGSASVPRAQRMTMNNLKKYPSQQEQFARSASARLPRKEEDPSARDGERKREESMKRLLEWKQRMLQSPLTRKMSQQQAQQLGLGSPGSTGNPFLSKSGQLQMEAEMYLEQEKQMQAQHQQQQLQQQQQQQQQQQMQHLRVDNKSNLEYNSYSSDDEDGTENTPAGRSTPNVSASASAELESSETVPPAEASDLDPKELPPPPSTSAGDDTLNTSQQSFSSATVSVSVAVDDTDDCSNIYENNSIAAASTPKTAKPLTSVGSFKEKMLPLEPPKYKPVYDHSSILKSPIQQPQTKQQTDQQTKTPEELHSNEDDAEDMSFEYTDEDLDEALQAEVSDETKTTIGDDMIDVSSENQSFYMPMTPKKPVLTNEVAEMKLTAMDILNSIQKGTSDPQDENTYIEMTNGLGGKCVFGDDLKSTYEMIMVQNSPPKADQEPLYMELSQLHSNSLEKKPKPDVSGSSKKNAPDSATSTLKKKQSDRNTLSKKHNKRNDLPDILKSNNSYLKSDDSSDADDESAKDHDKIKIKAARSRFSLSDTFRPASYYLGASSSTPLGDCIDSSDSEIVSPPPIPTTALPLDEHNNDEMFLSENFDTVKRRDKGSSKSNSRCSLLNPSDHRQPSQTSLSGSIDNKSQSSKNHYESNRSSLQSNLYLGSCYNVDGRYDNGSNTSSDYDLYRRLKVEPAVEDDASRRTSTSLSETESIELRRSSSKMDVATRNKRRPISEDSLNEIQVLGGYSIDETLSNASFDQYLGNLENVYVNSEKNSSSRMSWIHDSLTNLPAMDSFKNGHDNSIYYENVEMQPRAKSTTGNRTDDEAKAFYDSLEDVAAHEKVTLSPLKEKNLSIHDARCVSEDLMAAGRSNLNIEIVDSVTTMSSMDLDQRSSCTVFDLTQTTTPAHSRGNSNLSDSAPYYYSDLQSRDSPLSDISKLSDLARIKYPLKLNNQREVGVKKAGISHIHNPISHVKAANILTAAEKDHEIDQRNIYESDRMVDKNVNKMLEVSLSSNNSKNYYNNKMMNNKPSQLEEPRVSGEVNSSTSILASILKSSNSPSSNQVLAALSNQASASSKSSLNISTEMSASGDQLWEEDSLWRDNLRRASHMHAKSMESLDHLNAGSSMQSKLSTLNRKHLQRQAGKAITRDVTYVNDALLTKAQTMKKHHKSQNSSDDNDVYVQLASNSNMTDSASSDTTSDVYEVLRDETKYDIDRENIRQWDLMSSGLVNSANKCLETEGRDQYGRNGKQDLGGKLGGTGGGGGGVSSRDSTLKRKQLLGLDGSYQAAKGAEATASTSSTSNVETASAVSSSTVDSNEYTPSPGSSHVFATSSDAHVHKKHSNTTH